jgi:hypothetical protein
MKQDVAAQRAIMIRELLALYDDPQEAFSDFVAAWRGGAIASFPRVSAAVGLRKKLSDADLIRRVLSNRSPLPPAEIIAAATEIDPDTKPNSIRAKLHLLLKKGILSRTRHGKGFTYKLR